MDNSEEDLDKENINRNTAELGKVILALSSAGVGLLKLKSGTLDCMEQISASFFMLTIISLFFAYWCGSYSGIKLIKDGDLRDSIIFVLNIVCNLCFIFALVSLTISIWS